MIYQPLNRQPGGGFGGTLCVRTTGDPRRLVETIRHHVTKLNSAVSVTEAKTMEDNLNRNLLQERFVAMIGGFSGLLALMLAAVGLHGVMSEAVTRRTREIGIRMALGAEAGRVLWMVLRDSIAMVLIGAIIGILAVLVLTRYAEALLFGVKAHDPVTLVSAVLLLLGVTMLAGFLRHCVPLVCSQCKRSGMNRCCNKVRQLAEVVRDWGDYSHLVLQFFTMCKYHQDWIPG
jgi:predicted lysophospholipase L1 biosynthesis ABC-type transport system permease subunit